MGFFKGIGKAVKKGLKQVSFKNLVKVGSMFDPTGLVGGLQDAHFAKKEAREQERLGNQQKADELNAHADMLSKNSGQIAMNQVINKTNAGSFIDGATRETGATIIDSSMKQWFKNNWKKIAMISGGVVAVIVVVKMLRKPNNRR